MGFDILGTAFDIFGGGLKIVGDIAGSALSTVGSIFTGDSGQAAVPVTPGMEMGQLSIASESSALGVPAATGGVSTGLSTLTSVIKTGVGIYGQLAQIEATKGMTEAQKIAAQTKLMEAEALKIYAEVPAAAPAAAIPTLAQQPVYVTPAAAPAAPNYLLYIGLAILAFLLLGKKIK